MEIQDAHLFQSGRLNEYLGRQEQAAIVAVRKVSPEEIRFSPDSVVERIVEQHQVEPVNLDFARMTRTEPTETTIAFKQFDEWYETPGQKFSVVVPMTGDSKLLTLRADTYSLGPTPRGFDRGDALVFSLEGASLTAEQAMIRIAAVRLQLEQMIGWSNSQALAWRPQLRAVVETHVRARKKALDNAAALSAGLNIPISSAAPDRQINIPVSRKVVRPEPEPSESLDEPKLADAIYEDVLRTIGGLARALERLPRTAAKFSEEELRDLVLFILNSNYEGAARGEVFNGQGKTDILLTWRDRNAFIGECKFWGGQRRFNDAIDQLMGYVVWRDTKAALLLFIRSGNPSDLIDKADASLRAHPAFRSASASTEPDVRRDYLFTAKDDPQRFIRLALLPVVVPSP